jgi:hypothetical protein
MPRRAAVRVLRCRRGFASEALFKPIDAFFEAQQRPLGLKPFGHQPDAGSDQPQHEKQQGAHDGLASRRRPLRRESVWFHAGDSTPFGPAMEIEFPVLIFRKAMAGKQPVPPNRRDRTQVEAEWRSAG